MPANDLIVEFGEQRILDLQVPYFELREASLTIIQLPGGGWFADYEAAIGAILSRRTTAPNTTVHSPLSMASDYHEPPLRRALRPMRVREYLERFMNPAHQIDHPFFEEFQINRQMSLRDLTAPQLRLLALCVTRSWTAHLMFDLRGIDPIGGKQLFSVAQRMTKAGAAILMFDEYPEFEAECDQYLKTILLTA